MKISNRQIIIDLDNTITINDYSKEYQNKDVNKAVVETMRKIKSDEITILTARNMKTYAGDIEKINNFTKPIAVKWLRDNKIEYNNIIFGKPWCKEEGHYVDDKNISIEEFIFLSLMTTVNIPLISLSLFNEKSLNLGTSIKDLKDFYYNIYLLTMDQKKAQKHILKK